MNTIAKSIFMGLCLLTTAVSTSHAADHSAKQHNHMMPSLDERISLGLSPKMKLHQLKNMRSHVEAVQTIVGLIAEGRFEAASTIAHDKLGLNNEMNAMCDKINNDAFKEIGLSFHNSGDELGEVLLTKDVTLSLKALNTTMGYCVQCHATFRQ